MYKILSVFLFVFISVSVFAQSGGVVVSVGVVQSGLVAPGAEYTGEIRYVATSRVAAERAGRVELSNVREGTSVKNGEVLVILNRDILLHSIRAEEAKVEQQKLALNKAQRDFDRSKILFRDNAISRQRYDDSETEYMVQMRLFEAFSASLMVMREEYARATITAPFDGTILARHVNLHEWVNAGSPIADIASRQLEVVVNVPQSVVANVRQGMEVEVTAVGRVHKGVVRSIIPQGNAVSRNFPVIIDLTDESELLGGMDCRVNIPSSQAISAKLVPRDAVLRRSNRNVIFTVADNKAVMIPVELVGYTGIFAGVHSDELKDGMPVVTRGYERLSNGQSVVISGL